MKYYIILLLLLFTCGTIATAQVTDSSRSVQRTEQTPDTAYEEEADFAPGLFALALLFVAVMFIWIGCGIVLTTATLVAIFAMVSFGIISTSVIVGLYKRSLLKGIKTFYILCSIVCSTVFGAIGLLILNDIYQWWLPHRAVLSGAGLGLIAGWLVGLITFYLLRRLVEYFNSKLKIASVTE